MRCAAGDQSTSRRPVAKVGASHRGVCSCICAGVGSLPVHYGADDRFGSVPRLVFGEKAEGDRSVVPVQIIRRRPRIGKRLDERAGKARPFRRVFAAPHFKNAAFQV